MHHQIDADAFLGWYTYPPSGYPDLEDDFLETITAYRNHDDDAGVYRDAWNPEKLRLTCLVALVNAEIRKINNKVGMYIIRPIAEDGEVYAAYSPLLACPKHINRRWDSFCIVPLRPRSEQPEHYNHSLDVE